MAYLENIFIFVDAIIKDNMKLRFIIAAVVMTAACVSGCEKYDDTPLRTEINSLKDKIKTLEDRIDAMNSNISSLQSLVTSLNGKVFVNSVTEFSDGYLIAFSDGKTATITNGEDGNTPVIGVKEDKDGVYYWTLDGEWLKGTDGQKLRVSGQDAIAPKLKIEDGYWYLSSDDGKTWTKAGKATGDDGDSFFGKVSYDDSFVYFTLKDGTTFKVCRGASGIQEIVLIPDYADGSVDANDEYLLLRFRIVPESAAKSVAALDATFFNLQGTYTRTKADAGDLFQIPIVSITEDDGILTIKADGTVLSEQFRSVSLGASACLSIDDGITAVATNYFPLYSSGLTRNGHELVDLGLSVLWATCNVGAAAPEETGDLFAWGETETKETFSWDNYKYVNMSEEKLEKYNYSELYGPVDYKQRLEPEDDAASVNWGGEWRTPTLTELQELVDNCSFIHETLNGVKGYKVCSNKPGFTSNSIFIPEYEITPELKGAAFHSSMLCWDRPSLSFCFCIAEDGEIAFDQPERQMGLPVRPVCNSERRIPAEQIVLTPQRAITTDGTSKLQATVYPTSASDPYILWSSSNIKIVGVDANGYVYGRSAGSAVITATTIDGDRYAECTVTVVDPEAVDLGLSVKWASFNVGATKPEDYGDYYAWGEREPKTEYSWKTYKWGNYSDALTKYTEAQRTVLNYSDDAASYNWSGGWRMPTVEEFDELRLNCSWSIIELNGIRGNKISAKNGNWIFLPFASSMYYYSPSYLGEQGNYWTSSNYEFRQGIAWQLSTGTSFCSTTTLWKYRGSSVRPVRTAE